MIIKQSLPPLFEAIADKLPMARMPGVIFTFGNIIYNPSGVAITSELMAHESVHSKRQDGCVDEWWQKYLTDSRFRFEEELPAHQAEYREFFLNNKNGKRRNNRRLYLHSVASRLASPLYGKLISYDEARKIIKSMANH